MQIAVIVPTLNEERALATTLERLTEQAGQVVVSDGGSSDGTKRVASSFPVTWVEGTPGRGGQLNRGAAASRAEALLFLHADTRLPDGGLDLAGRALASGAVAGGFSVRFDSRIPIMAVGERLVNLRTRLTRVPLGDQAQFVRRDAFDRLGGFRDWPILEDLDLMRRAKRLGRIAILPQKVVTSDRRYAQYGVFRTVALNWMIWARFLSGDDPSKLAEMYKHYR